MMGNTKTNRRDALEALVLRLRGCTVCPKMHRPAVSGGAVWSRVITIGQAPGTREPVAGRPFAWTAGKTLFGWFERACGMTEAEFRSRIYMAAVCRCFPGKNAAGGDRVPDAVEIFNCSHWLEAEIALLQPALIIPIGKLAIQQFMAFDMLTDVIGKKHRVAYRGHAVDLVPLPHPSGASPWHRMEPGRTLLDQALEIIVRHPAWPQAPRSPGDRGL
jgi:uracil-DNA glycosylase